MSDKPWNSGQFHQPHYKIHRVSDAYKHCLRLDGAVPPGSIIHDWLGHHRWAVRTREGHSVLQFTSEQDVASFVAAYQVWLDDRASAGNGPASS